MYRPEKGNLSLPQKLPFQMTKTHLANELIIVLIIEDLRRRNASSLKDLLNKLACLPFILKPKGVLKAQPAFD